MTHDDSASPTADRLAQLVVGALDELKGVDVRALDVREQTTVADMFVIASGTSRRHVQSLADRVLERTRDAGVRALGVEGERGSDWLLVDLGDVVVHVMSRERRDFYNLEKLWSMGVDGTATGSA